MNSPLDKPKAENSAANRIHTTQIWETPGGIHPPENKEQSLSQPISAGPLPDFIVLPLSMHIGAPASPIVQVGDHVLKGQIVAEPQGFVSAAIHSSISGTVVAIEDRPLPHSSGMLGLAIVIESDHKDEWIELSPIENYREKEASDLVELLRKAGLAGMGGAGFPTSVKLSPRNPINTLILNGTECEPYITSDHSLMRERADDVVKGALLLAYILGEPENIIIGVEDNKPDAIELLKIAAETHGNDQIRIVDFPTKYPSGGEKQLIQIVTGKEVASGTLPSELGIVVQNVGSTVAALEAITEGKPLISRITTLVGKALKEERNLEVRIGTPVQNLLDFNGYNESKAERIVMGGPMMGFSLPDTQAPVTKITNCLLIPTRKELPAPPPAQACIRCGHCAESCPASLLPQQLFWYAQISDEDKLKDHNLFDCIECGACAYVCPSNIPLVQYYRAAKGSIREAEKEKVKSDQARIRFEARQERLEKEAKERDAKRKARTEAAKLKQAKMAEKTANASASGDNPDTANDLVAQAMARVNAAKVDPEAAKGKLERQKETFAERVETTKAKIETADTDELKAKYSAQLKNAEKKLQGIVSKLEGFNEPDQADKSTASVESKPSDVPTKKLNVAEQAIARAQKKSESMTSMSETDKLKASLESLMTRQAKSKERLKVAEESGADTVDALRSGLEKINEKISAAEEKLKELSTEEDIQTSEKPKPQEQDVASLAIARAQEKSASMSSMSETDKLKTSLYSLKVRQAKSEERLKAAEESGADTVDALRTGLEKITEKISAAEEQLAQLMPLFEPAQSSTDTTKE